MAKRGRPSSGYVEPRGSRWGFRFVVPIELRDYFQTDKIRQPLKAATKREAREEAAPLAVEYSRMASDLLALPVQTRKKVALDRWMQAQRDAADAVRQAFIERPALEDRLARIPQNAERIAKEMIAAAEGTLPLELQAEVAERGGVEAMWMRTGLRNSLFRRLQQRKDSDDLHSYKLPRGAKGLSKGHQRHLLEALRADAHRQIDDQVVDADAEEALLTRIGIPTDTRAKIKRPANPKDPRIIAGFKIWTAAAKQEPQTIRKLEVHIRRLSQLFDDCEVSTLTTEHVEQYIEAVRSLPDTRYLKAKEKALPIQKLMAMRASDPTMPPMGDVTVRKTFEAVHAFLRFAKGKKWLKTNPAAEIGEKPKVPKRRKKDKRQGLTPDEMQALLTAMEQRYGVDSEDTWLAYVLAYSGSSPEEIAQLDRANVRQEQGIWVFDINGDDGRRIKNDNRWRTVPIHPKLIERGFIDFATKGKGKRVFGSLERDREGYFNSNVARRIIRLMRTQLGITDKRKVFYSIRHAFTTAARGRIPYEIQLALVGHMEVNEIHGEYGETPLMVMAKWIEKVDPLTE